MDLAVSEPSQNCYNLEESISALVSLWVLLSLLSVCDYSILKYDWTVKFCSIVHSGECNFSMFPDKVTQHEMNCLVYITFKCVTWMQVTQSGYMKVPRASESSVTGPEKWRSPMGFSNGTEEPGSPPLPVSKIQVSWSFFEENSTLDTFKRIKMEIEPYILKLASQYFFHKHLGCNRLASTKMIYDHLWNLKKALHHKLTFTNACILLKSSFIAPVLEQNTKRRIRCVLYIFWKNLYLCPF